MLVSAAAALLECILAHNESDLPRLYLTGVFIFALAYCGSNLLELAKLFKSSHLRQSFRCVNIFRQANAVLLIKLTASVDIAPWHPPMNFISECAW